MNLRKLGLLSLVVMILAGVGFFYERTHRQISKSPNIIFITVDTLRADHTPFGNYSRNTMPETVDFFGQGIRFTQAETVRTCTSPAYASLFTGLYPYKHGVRNLYFALHDNLNTLPEQLKAKGYVTAGFVSSFVMIGRFSGFNQGFDVYDDTVEEKERNRENYERTAASTVTQVVQWLKGRPKDKPLFLFLHFIDPHGPYTPPAAFQNRFRSKEQRVLDVELIPAYQRIPELLNLYSYVDQYDSEIYYLDHELARLYRAFEEEGLMQNSWYLFTADHGESLGEKDIYFAHGQTCYEAESHVPMVWLPPSPLRERFANGSIHEPASLVDVMPTVVDILGMPGQAQMDGKSLLSAMGGRPDNKIRFVERVRGTTHTFAARNQRYKLIAHAEDSGETSYELYDLMNDRGETRNLISAMEAPAALRSALEDYMKQSSAYALDFTPKRFTVDSRSAFIKGRKHNEQLSEEDKEKMKALGYADD